MNKLKLFVSVGICGILFTGCRFFDEMGDIFGVGKIEYTESKNCIPADLKERFANKSYYRGHNDFKQSEYFIVVHGYYETFFADMNYKDKSKCYDLALESYNEAIKKAKKIPTNIDEENEFCKQWSVCDKMPDWLNAKLNEYISQNGTEASDFKQNWQMYLSGKSLYNRVECKNNKCNSKYGKSAIEKCRATKIATQAIENDLIDLGNGKKAKCSDLSYKDAPKCLAHFKTAYNKIYKEKGVPLEGCVPADLKERLRSYTSSSVSMDYYINTRTTATDDYSKYYDSSFEWYGSKTICNEFMIESYNEVIKQTKQLPTILVEEEELHKKWAYCNIMPKWIESKLNEYIEQNKGSDTEYVKASKFKEMWKSHLNGYSSYAPLSGLELVAYNQDKELQKRLQESQGKKPSDINFDGGITACFANKEAVKAIENDLIDLGNGKKAKCADLSWNDAQKCLDYFNGVYDKTYKVKEKEVIKKIDAINLKIERNKYEKQNKK